ncbi:hypothetical protein CB0940_11742 [Cercospora beticola]|uniref:Uncharacterized protein n=1 Tax=Cercospora beticola TaxID=122368 RepID=A0A2G5IE30_CERBT|nr:hypothetical protein CB0940_11742 [Cercospora beticola]PIB03035.1 hypothetical protein CB0940_11742 [Cercospora beticola]WPB04100.1 hypothetical protein RHO25_008744 [Cercospora beticola]
MASLLHSNRSAGRSKSNTSHTTISTSLPQLTLSTRNIRSGSNLSHRNESPRSPFSPASSRSRPKHIVVKTDRDMSSQKASSPFPNTNTSAKQSSANHAKLHRRGGSGSLPGPPSPFVGGHQFTTPYATYEESYPDVTPTSATASSTPKIKPYLRKMSSSKDDQGTIDLNKSIAENERLAGLGISDFASRSAADVSFGHPSRRQTHARTTSIGSQVSNGSGTFRPGQPFVHPATKVPRPYTPPGASYASSLNDEHANESDDVVEDEFRLGAFRTKRSMSITSTNPTPLSQSHTASDLGLVPKLTSASQSNLSTMSRASSPSGTKGRSRRGTDHSELALSPQTTGGRPSIDKAFSLVSGRRSDPDTQSRDELIRNARRKFEEKEARKDSKQQKRRESDEARKEAAKQRKQSTASRSAKSEEKIPAKKRKGSAATVLGGAQQEDEELADTVYGRSYENYRPAHDATLPRYGDRPGESEKTGQIQYSTTKHEPRSGSWMRFSTWVQTRMLSCGGGGH